MEPDQKLQLQYYRDQTFGAASYQAANILCFFANDCKAYLPAIENRSAAYTNPTENPIAEEKMIKTALQIYPNPSQGTFTIHVEKAENVRHIYVVDVSGKFVTLTYNVNENNIKVSLKNASAGMHQVLITFADGTRQFGEVLIQN
jgi:Secretion system C-terminal sorting domain